MKSVFLLFIIIGLGCQVKPHSQAYIYSSKDNHLSLDEKIAILFEATSQKDDFFFYSIALMYAQNKDWKKAKQNMLKAVKYKPLNGLYHLLLADYNANLTSYKEAYDEAKIAYELGVSSKSIKIKTLLAQMAVETSDTLEGSKFVSNYYELNKTSLKSQLLMAKFYLIKKNYLKAEQLIKIILEKDTLNIDAWKIAYSTYLHTNNKELTIEFGNKLIKNKITDSLYYYPIGKLYEEKKQIDKAAVYFIKAYNYTPSVKNLYAALKNYMTLNKFDSVLVYSDSIFSGINYTNKNILLLRARAFTKRYKYKKAFSLYTRLVKIDSTNLDIKKEQEIIKRKIAYLAMSER